MQLSCSEELNILAVFLIIPVNVISSFGLRKLFEADPFHIHGINNYSFKEFTKYNCQAELGFWFE